MAYPNNRSKTTRSRFATTNRQPLTAPFGTIDTTVIGVPTTKVIVTYNQDMNTAVLPPAQHLPFNVNQGGGANLTPLSAEWQDSTTLWVFFNTAILVTNVFTASATGAILTAQGGSVEAFTDVL